MTFRVVIPARFDSSRLPGKALLPLAGKPMLQWVHERAKSSQATEVIVARARACARAASKRARMPLASVRGHLSARWPFQVNR